MMARCRPFSPWALLLAALAAIWCNAAVASGPGRGVSVLVSGGSMMAGDEFAESTVAAMRLHFAGCRRIALVLHASYPDDRDAMERRLQKAFRQLGLIEAQSLHRHDDAGARELLLRADGIFVGGGETFALLAELYRTGQLLVIRERVAQGVPYAGSSAGANVAGLAIGTTNDFPVADVPGRTALGIFPAVINPHHPLPGTPDFEARRGKIAIYRRYNPDDTVLGLANASLARLQGGRVVLMTGSGWLYSAAGVRPLEAGGDLPELAPKS